MASFLCMVVVLVVVHVAAVAAAPPDRKDLETALKEMAQLEQWRKQLANYYYVAWI